MVFADSEFKPGGQALYHDPTRPPEGALPAKVVKWKRPHEFASKPQLFCDGVAPGDVIQGTLGDCWFLGAVSVVATREDLLQKLFLSSDPEEGKYVVQFFKEGEWLEVTVDDLLPCDISGKPLYASCKNENEIWVMILEKAYAKVHGNYEALMGGSAEYALRDLTGGNASKIETQNEDVQAKIESGELWKDLLKQHSEGVLLGCARVDTSGGIEEETSQGILKNHCYGVLSLKEVQGNQLVKVRNPWGEKEWTGRWSDSSSEWNSKLRKELGVVTAEDGTFWMCFEDFIREFNTINVCRIFPETYTALATRGEWKGDTAGGNFQLKTWCTNPQYTLVVNEESEVTIVLDQADARMKPGPGWNEYKANICYTLVRDPKKKGVCKALTQQTFVGVSGQFLAVRQVNKTWDLEPGQYLIVPSTYNPGVEASFTISVMSNRPVTLEDSKPVPKAEIPEVDAKEADLPEVPVVNQVKETNEEDTSMASSSVDALITMVSELSQRLSTLEEVVAQLSEPKLRTRNWMIQ